MQVSGLASLPCLAMSRVVMRDNLHNVDDEEGGGGVDGSIRSMRMIPLQAVPQSPAAPVTNHHPAAPSVFNTTTTPGSVADAGGGAAIAGAGNNNPYISISTVPVAGRSTGETLLKALNRCGKRLEDNARWAGGVAENFWNHLRTGQSVGDAAMARLAQGTKVLTEGGHDRVFRQLFPPSATAGEKLQGAYACYLSTSSGPVIGTLYVSTARLAFCSDYPLHASAADHEHKVDWLYYKVIVPLDQLRAVNPSFNKNKRTADKYIQVVAIGGHEFWFMGFVSYERALKDLLQAQRRPSAAIADHMY